MPTEEIQRFEAMVMMLIFIIKTKKNFVNKPGSTDMTAV
jgi:hypothetical protein